MTENEALNIIFAQAECEAREHNCDKNKCDECDLLYMQGTVREHKEALQMAIKSLEEIQQYRAIGSIEKIELTLAGYKELGTMEELKILKEKSVAKKVMGLYHNVCPTCSWVISHNNEYCEKCGQKLDWE